MASCCSSPSHEYCSRSSSSTQQPSTPLDSQSVVIESPVNSRCTSGSASFLPWLWVIQAVSCCQEIHISTLQELIDVAPVVKDDYCDKTRELIALRCLEDLFDSASTMNCDGEVYRSLETRPGLDFSSSCEDVLQQILEKIPLSDIKEVGAELLKWDIVPFIVHKRATIKSDLEQLKESIIDGTHPYTHLLRKSSGLVHQNGGSQVLINDNECNDLSKKANGNCTSCEKTEAKGNSVHVILEIANKSSKDFLLDKILPSKRPSVELDNEHDMRYQHEKQVDIDECDDHLINAKKIRCSASLNVESNKEQPASPHGKQVLENSSENFLLVSERGGHNTNNDVSENLGEGSVEGSHDRCMASNCCKSSSHDQVVRDESNIPFNDTTMLHHTSECEPYQQHGGEPVPVEVLLPDEILQETKDDAEHKVPKIVDESHPKRKIDLQLKEPIATDDNSVDDNVNACGEEISSDSDGYHNEAIDLAAEKQLSSRCTFGNDVSVSTGLTEKNLCVKCNEVGELLVCKTTTCPIMVHKRCLVTSAQIDGEGNFLCPFCAYCQAISEYRDLKKEASLSRKELAIFICKDIEHQNTSTS